MVRFSPADKKNIARAQKQEVYEEDSLLEKGRFVGYRCKKCRIVLPLHLLEVDHIKPLSLGGNDLPANLQLLCSRCNKRKGSKMPASLAKTASKATTKKKPTSTKPKVTRTKAKTKSPIKKRATSKKAVAKKTIASKATRKKSTVKKAPPKKAVAKKATSKKVLVKKTIKRG